LTSDDGLPGDAWSRQRRRDVDAQLAVMRREVAELIANGQPLTLFGDNLFVDFDLSAATGKLPGCFRNARTEFGLFWARSGTRPPFPIFFPFRSFCLFSILRSCASAGSMLFSVYCCPALLDAGRFLL
jgi:hypothetical protein